MGENAVSRRFFWKSSHLMHQIWTSETTSHDLMQLFPPLKPVRWFLMHQMCTFELKSPYLMQLFPFFSARSTDLMDPKSTFHCKSSSLRIKNRSRLVSRRLLYRKFHSISWTGHSFYLICCCMKILFLFRVQWCRCWSLPVRCILLRFFIFFMKSPDYRTQIP